MPRFSDQLVLITGASRGIGRSVAQAFAREGAHVLLTARTLGALEELDDEIQKQGGSATLIPLDLKDNLDALDQAAASIHERWGKLDVLIGNAGVLGAMTPLTHLKPKDWDELWQVNVTANWRLLRAFDPLLRQAPAGRAIFVSSGAATKNRPYWGGYGATKAALEHLVKTYAEESRMGNVKANLINPGATRTMMRAKAMPGEDPDTLPHPDQIAPLFLDMASADWTESGQVIDARTALNITV